MEGAVPSAAERRVGRLLFAVACVILLVASLRGIGDPWERSLRGGNGAAYSHSAVGYTLHYGLGVTLGTPAFVVETEQGPERHVNWHHPPGYWLYLALPAALFGATPTTLRAGHLVLFLPALLALFLLIRRVHGEFAAGCAAVLFASCPLVAYFGPMVAQDGVTLSFGLVTAWLFQRHLDEPSRRRWWAVALAFYLTCSVDFPGYWWGLALFVMALGHRERKRAIVAVFALFPVSVAAFATMAIHYGLAMNGLADYLRELAGTLRGNPEAAGHDDLAKRFAHAMRDLWIGHHNLPVLALAGLGALVLPFGGPAIRRVALTGIALTVPGVVNYVTMLGHALGHTFWSLVGFGGLCVLAALTPITGLRLLGRGTWRTGLGVVCLLATAGTVAFGTIGTHDIIGRYPPEPPNDTPAMMAKALPWLDHCAVTITSAKNTTQIQYGHTSVFFDIDTADKLRVLLTFAKSRIRGRVGVVVHPDHRAGDLPALLDTMAPRREVDGLLIYQLLL